MFKILLSALFCLFFTSSNIFAEETILTHDRSSKWDVSPIQVQYFTAFFAIELLAYNLFSPEFVKQEVDSSDYDFDKDSISVPSWAYQLGNYGPEILTLGMYSYYLFGSDKYAFEKAFVFSESMIISQGITFGAKYAANKKRPDETNYLSFPSGHTTHAFTVATWMSLDIFHGEQFKGNYLVSSIPLFYASYIGWSRVDSDKHSTEDVLMGAFIGGITSYLMYHFHFDDYGEYRFLSKNKIVLTPKLDPVNKRYSMNIGFML